MKSIDVILLPLGTTTFAHSRQWRGYSVTLGKNLTPSVTTHYLSYLFSLIFQTLNNCYE
jgi:hypothetical protein